MPSVALGELMAVKAGSVDPAKFPDEVFDLYSIPAFDKGEPEIVAGSAIGSTKQVVKTGDILLSKIVPHIRRSWIVGDNRDRRLIASGEWIVIRSDRVASAYIRHVVVGNLFHARFMQTVSGVGGSLLRARPAQVAKIEIPLPPIPEQIRIAAILDQAEVLRVKRRETLAQLDSLTQSIFIEMFGDPGANPKQWSIQPLSALIKGKPNNGIFKKNDEYGEGLPVVWVGELFKDNGINCSNSQRLLPSERELEQYGLHHGDVLFCRSSLKLAGIGYNNVYLGESNKALFECHVIRITPDKNKLDPMFLNFALRMPSQRLKLFKHAKTVTMTTIDQDGLLRIDLPVPPLQLQKIFAEKLNAIERLKAVHAKAQVEQDTLFASLQHRAFRGEI